MYKNNNFANLSKIDIYVYIIFIYKKTMDNKTKAYKVLTDQLIKLWTIKYGEDDSDLKILKQYIFLGILICEDDCHYELYYFLRSRNFNIDLKMSNEYGGI